MSKKQVIALALVVGILMGLVVGMFFRQPPAKLSVWGVSQINLIKQGEAKNGQYVGAIWRVIGDTSSMNISSVKFNQTVVQAVNPSALPQGVSITGEITFRVWQSSDYPPYWEVPFSKITTTPITVVPKTYGIQMYWDWGLKYKQLTDVYIEPLQVDVYTLDWSQAKLHIPFFFYASKTGVGPLVPSQYTKQLENAYLIDVVSSRLVLNQNVTADIILTNPKDISEEMKIHIIFPITMPEYVTKPFAETGFLTIQPPKGGVPVSTDNTFKGAESEVTGGILYTIFNGWTSGNYNPWAYYYYWMGDPTGRDDSQFKGNAVWWYSGYMGKTILVVDYGSFSKWDDGTTKPLITVNNNMLSEGLVMGCWDKTNVFDYPGWYRPGLNETYYDKLYPFPPSLYYSYSDNFEPTGTKPAGLSLCEYIRTKYINVPQKATGEDTHDSSQVHSNFQSKQKPSLNTIDCLNPYNPGLYAGGVPEVTNFIANLPSAGASWAVWVDISSELADAIVVTENYLDVRIENFTGGNVEINPKDSVVLTMDLVNTLDIPGQVYLQLQVKEAIPFDSSGTGFISFDSKEIKKKYQVTIYNSYANTIREKLTGHFTLAVWNGEKYTSSVDFVLTFLPGAGLPNTGISVRCINKNNPSQGIESVSITVFWGSSKEKAARGITTKGGYASIPLDIPFEGKIDIIAVDNYGRFYTANKTDQYVSPTSKNEFTIEMIPIVEGGGFFDIMQYLPYIIGGGIGAIGIAVGAYAVKRRREEGVRY
jgi:hypothetical protein